MIITIEGSQYKIPASLSEITLWQRIEFDKKYGIALREQLKKIIEIKSEGTRALVKELDFTLYHTDLACKTLSFFGNIPLDIVQNTNISEVMTVYHHTMAALSEDVNFSSPDFKLDQQFEWQGEEWRLAPPELKYDSTLTFGELIGSKQIIQNIFELGDEKWEALLPLCCIYFRKKDEKYSDELAREDGPRYELMKTLPLTFALHVAFFLSVCQNSYMQTFRSFGKDEAKVEAVT